MWVRVRGGLGTSVGVAGNGLGLGLGFGSRQIATWFRVKVKATIIAGVRVS